MAMWAFVLAVVVAWQVYSSFVPPVVIPSPQRVLLRFGQLWTEPRYLLYAWYSFYHVVVSVAVAFVAGVALSLVAHYFAITETAIYRRLSPFLNSFTGVGWAFLALIWIGVNDAAVIFTTSVALLPFVIINAGAGLRELNREMVEMSVSFTRRPLRQIFRVILPMLFPYLFSTIRLCFGIGAQIALTSELLCGSPGLGTLINVAKQRYWTDMVFAVALTVLIFVYLIDRVVFAAIQKRIRRRYVLG
jgi:ABC-type nitrate/sulfonate/bicarbonate transport system permease component